MTREIIQAESNYGWLQALYDAHCVICEYYEQIYDGPGAAAHFSREYCVMRDSKTKLYYRLEELANYGNTNQGSNAAQDMDRRSEGGLA